MHMHRLCNLFRLYLEQQYFVFKTKNKASFSQGDFNVVTPAFVESLIFANSSQGRRKVCESGGLGGSNIVDIICPPALMNGIRVNVPNKFGNEGELYSPCPHLPKALY